MPYQSLLNRNEEVALDLRPHWWYFGRQILTGIPLLILVILLLNLDGGWFKTGASWVIVALVIAWAVWLGLKYLSWARPTSWSRTSGSSTAPVSSPGRAPRSRSTASRTSTSPAHVRADHRGREPRGPVGGGAGHHPVRLRAASRRRAAGDLPPDGAREHRQSDRRAPMGDAVAKAVAGSSARPQGSVGASVPEQIEQLARLRDQGHITPEEYEAKKPSSSAACSGNRPRRTARRSRTGEAEASAPTSSDARPGEQVVGVVALARGDDTAAESGAGEARARAAGPCTRRRGVERGGRDLEVVAQARVARQHQGSERAHLAGPERAANSSTCVLGDDVTGSRVVAHLLQRASRSVATRGVRPASHAAALGVRAAGERACSPEWITTTPSARGIGIGSTWKCAAVEEQRVVPSREERGELVHEPAGHADRRDLGRERAGTRRADAGRRPPARSANVP